MPVAIQMDFEGATLDQYDEVQKVGLPGTPRTEFFEVHNYFTPGS